MSEAHSGNWNLAGLIVQQDGKPQRVLSNFLRMNLNLRYGLDAVIAGSVVEASEIMQVQHESIICTVVVQNQEFSSRTALAALSQKGKVSLFLVMPRQQIEKHQALLGKVHNLYFVTWEQAFGKGDTSLQAIVDKVFLDNRILTLLDNEEPLSHADLKENVQQRIQNLDALPTLPKVVLRIIALIEDPETTIDDMEAVIASDASIVWKLLEVMKAPAFTGMRRSEWTLRDIIVRLGIRQVGAIAQQIKLMNSFVKSEDSSFDLERFWVHSLGSAMIAHKLYTEGLINLDEKVEFNQYWIAALLHDVGKLVLGLFFPKYFDNVLSRMSPDADFGRDFREAEAEVGRVGMHEDIGRLLLLKADASEQLVDAVGTHHAGSPAPGALICLLHLSDNLCKDLGLGYLPEEKGTYSPAVLQKLDLDETKIKKLKDDLGEAMVKEIEEVVNRSTAEKKDQKDQRSPRGSKAEASKSTPAATAQEDESQDTLTALLDHVQERLEEYPSIEEDLRQDLLVDVEALRTQLQRKNINRQVVLALLSPFIETEFLGDLLGRLKRLLDQASPDAT